MGPFMKTVVWYLVVAMFVIGIAPRVDAAFSPSPAMLHQIDRNADLQKIQGVLETKMVQERLAQMGYTPEEIRARLAQLSDQQMHELALNLDQLQVGGDFWSVVVVLIIIAAVVWAVLYLTGHKVLVK